MIFSQMLTEGLNLDSPIIVLIVSVFIAHAK